MSNHDYNTPEGKAGPKVLDSQHFRSGEDVHIKLPTSHHGGLDVYINKDSSEQTILYRTTKRIMIGKALKNQICLHLP